MRTISHANERVFIPARNDVTHAYICIETECRAQKREKHIAMQ